MDLKDYLVIGVSSRALFDLEEENEIYEKDGLKAYSDYQIRNENEILKEGSAFNLVKAILNINRISGGSPKAEVVVVSRNSQDTGLRVFNSIEHYGLDISRAAFTSGESVSRYLEAFSVDLFLSAREDDVKDALESGFAAGLIYTDRIENRNEYSDQIRIAFDGDAVLFSEDSEIIYKKEGLESFLEHEKRNADKPLGEGPYARFLKTISWLQNEFAEKNIIRTALVTARNSPAHKRVIKTLREWRVRIDEAFYMGGVSKDKILKSFGAHIFFDDQDAHCEKASKVVTTAKVPNEKVEEIKKSGRS